MKFFDRNSNTNRINDDIAPVVHGLLENKQLFDDDGSDRPYVTNAVKYTRKKQDRRKTSEYEGDDDFVNSILDIFDFPPLDFQVNSWKTVDRLDRDRKADGRAKAGVFAAPTGFGKTEAFLGPLYQLLKEDRQNSTIVVYPRRALLQNQLERILEHIHDVNDGGASDLSVGVYMGGMPYKMEHVEDNNTCFEQERGTTRFKLANCWCGEDGDSHSFEFSGHSKAYTLTCEHDDDHSFTSRELVLSRKSIINDAPDIILTTLESLELFALKPNYDIIDQVDSVVLDEVHLYTGLRGAHASKIIDNLNDITAEPLLWLGASATIDSPTRFAKKLFDLGEHDITVQKPPESDYDRSHNDYENYYFLISSEEGATASSMMIQQLMLIGHSLMAEEHGPQGKILSFIDSISQINQKQRQLVNADHERELWQYHRSGSGYENWEVVADDMGFNFVDDELSLQPVFSENGFDAEQAAKSDILLSTSFLEVGIDVGDISVVTQYRTPQNISSFIQRTGRAARKEGMESHIFVFLSNLTGDANMFYRAERFLESDLRTPLKTDNDVVEWIHEQIEHFYEVGEHIDGERMRSPREEELTFFEEFVKERLGYEQFYQFLTEPGNYLSKELGLAGNLDQPLVSGPPLKTVKSALETKESSLEADEEEIKDYVEFGDNQVRRAENAFDGYLKQVQEQILSQIRTYEKHLEKFSTALEEVDGDHQTEQIEALEEKFDTARENVKDYRSLPEEERIEQYNDLLAEITQHAAQLMGVRSTAVRYSERQLPEIELGDIDDLQEAVSLLAGLAGDERIEELSEQRRQIYYLKQAADELAEYRGGWDEPEQYRPNKPYLSVWYVKKLLRAVYYFDRYLQVDGRSLSGEVWYVPPNYFDSSGRFFTVFEDPQQGDGSEEPIDSIVHSYAPYRSEYSADTGTIQLFNPDTEVIESSGDDTHSTVQFDFENVQTDTRPNMQIPEQIQLDEVSDLSGEAQNIVRYCPECLNIISDIDSCLIHNDSALGKIHSDPQIRTLIRSRTVEEEIGSLSLSEVTGDVMMEGVTLDITPAEYHGPEFGYGWSDDDNIQREIKSPDPPLGFSLDTRGVELDVSSFIESLSEEDIDEIAKYKDIDEVGVEYLGYHTAAHFLMSVVADVSGINETMLFYGMDQERGEVFVFERTEGGQGFVDLFFKELSTDPANVLEAMNRTAFNPQVLNERLWANRSVIEHLPSDRAPTQDEALEVVTEFLEIPYHQVRLRIAQEFISTADRAVQLSDEIGGQGLQTAYRVKNEVATAQIDGEEELPTESLRPLGLDLDALEDTIESIFVSPDIDGCVENLHLTECISGHDQTESLSYVILEALHDHLTETVPRSEASETMFDIEQPPAAEINDTNVFVTF